MGNLIGIRARLFGAAAISVITISPAFANLTINIQQADANLIKASFDGNLNLTGLSAFTAETENYMVESSFATLQFGFVGPASTPYPYLSTYHLSGPTSWDQANVVGLAVGYAVPSSFSGDHLMIEGNPGRLSISPGYVSGATLAGSENFEGTLASLGLSAGSYIYTMGSNTITVNIGNTGNSGANAAPEPASWAMFIGGFGLVGGVVRRKKARFSFT
jgi:hypothetical protein